MTRSRSSFSAAKALFLGLILLTWPLGATAQRHGAGMSSGSGISGISRPSGVKEEDSLKDFHQAMALQATSQQTAEFQSLGKSTESARAQLQALLEELHQQNGVAETTHREPVDQALENARSGSKKFQQGFSAAQKSGLKDVAKRLARADSDLEQEQKRLDQSLDVRTPAPEVAAHAENLSKALTDFYNQELALGREMSITLASGQDQTFNLPPVNHPVSIASRAIGVQVSGVLSQIASQGSQRTFKVELAADLSDVQQNITELLRAQLDRAENCGQRVAIQQARLTPSSPAGLLFVRLHFERWTCSRTSVPPIATELAEGDGTFEMKVTASVEKANTLKMVATFARIDATGMLGESLRSGSLGEDMRDAIAQSVLTVVENSADLKTTLPPAVENSAVVQSARFQDAGVGVLTLLLDGQIQISNEQADQLASQLNQALSAQVPVQR